MKEADRPGLMIYFDLWEPLLKSDNESLAELFRAAILYGKYGVVPEFVGINEILWSIIRPALDRDADRYEQTRLVKKYARYCGLEQKAGRVPLSREEWQHMLTRVDCVEHNQPSTKTASSTETVTDPTPNTISSPAANAAEEETQGDPGGREGETIVEEFEAKKRRAMELCRQGNY